MTAALDIFTINNLADDVDTLGTLRAEAKHLNEQIKVLEAHLKASGYDEINGDLFHATVSYSERSTVDWKTVAERAGASRQLITAHTTTRPIVTLRVSAHKKAA